MKQIFQIRCKLKILISIQFKFLIMQSLDKIGKNFESLHLDF